MEEPKPTVCVTCGNHLLPWMFVSLNDGYYLSRPCPRVDCGYMHVDFVCRPEWFEGDSGDWFFGGYY